MKKIIFVLLAGLWFVACNEQTLKAPSLGIDLPASYKSDSVVYNFIQKEVGVWNNFGKEVEKMYRRAEKFRKKDFNALSQRRLYDLVKLEYEYALLWTTQDIYVDKMLSEAEIILERATPQGAAKIIETQKQIGVYYQNLAQTFGTELKLDQNPYVLTPQEDSVYRVMPDSVVRQKLDSMAKVPR